MPYAAVLPSCFPTKQADSYVSLASSGSHLDGHSSQRAHRRGCVRRQVYGCGSLVPVSLDVSLEGSGYQACRVFSISLLQAANGEILRYSSENLRDVGCSGEILRLCVASARLLKIQDWLDSAVLRLSVVGRAGRGISIFRGIAACRGDIEMLF